MDDKLTTKEAITVLRNLQDWLYFSAMNGGTSIQREAIDMAIEALKQSESAQWVQMLINPRMYRCSNCNVAWNKRLVFDLDHHNEMVMKYCPCCGKKMLAEVDYE